MTGSFLDTNLVLRHITGDHPDHSPRSTRLLEDIERGLLTVETTMNVVFETVFTLQSLYKMPRPLIRDSVLDTLSPPGIILGEKPMLPRAFDIYVTTNLSFADAFHIAYMEHRGLAEIYSFDRGIDKITTVRRIEPS